MPNFQGRKNEGGQELPFVKNRITLFAGNYSVPYIMDLCVKPLG
ncbi:hypothetical protein [Bernardetia sp.]|nr:hypothetical protein [Bernardetia sp.]